MSFLSAVPFRARVCIAFSRFVAQKSTHSPVISDFLSPFSALLLCSFLMCSLCSNSHLCLPFSFYRPCILLFEEIDTAFTALTDTSQRKKKKEKRGRSRSASPSSDEGSGNEDDNADKPEKEDTIVTAAAANDDRGGSSVTGAENKPVRHASVSIFSFGFSFRIWAYVRCLVSLAFSSFVCNRCDHANHPAVVGRKWGTEGEWVSDREREQVKVMTAYTRNEPLLTCKCVIFETRKGVKRRWV